MTNLEQSIDVRGFTPGRTRWLAFLGPAVLVSVGYVDPGNWATDLEGGARFGYRLLWVLLASNLVAILLQTLAARLGIVAGCDLARACRDYYSKPIATALWGLSEIAIIACDIAEVLGSAIALNLLFHMPLVWGAIVTGFDVMLVLALQARGIRRLEAMIAAMILTIGFCLGLELILAQPQWSDAAKGLAPRIDSSSLYLAISIIGATVMPHNLYLHSSLVQTRRIGPRVEDQREALRYNLLDTAVGLNVAFLINAAILVLSAATFFTRGVQVTELQQAHHLLSPLLGSSVAAAVFAFALLISGQSSTITGTLAGQVVMEGFLDLRLPPMLRRMVTRGLAIVPSVIVLALYGEAGATQLLVLSQVVLSLQLPFAMIPLIRLTGDRRIMGIFASSVGLHRLAWCCAAAITLLNAYLILLEIGDGIKSGNLLFIAAASAVVVGLGWLLHQVSRPPLVRRRSLTKSEVVVK